MKSFPTAVERIRSHQVIPAVQPDGGQNVPYALMVNTAKTKASNITTNQPNLPATASNSKPVKSEYNQILMIIRRIENSHKAMNENISRTSGLECQRPAN